MGDHAKHASTLIFIAADLRANGDIHLVDLSEDGVSPSAMTLAGHLELIAMDLDWDAAMAAAKTAEARRG